MTFEWDEDRVKAEKDYYLGKLLANHDPKANRDQNNVDKIKIRIEDSVHVDAEKGITTVRLPFLEDPVHFFKKHYEGQSSNIQSARKVYLSQCGRNSETKAAVNKEFQKLQDLGFLAPLKDAPAEIKEAVDKAEFTHYYPWRSVWNDCSLSTPLRIIVDPSGSLLNVILPKGQGGVSSLHEILLRSRLGIEADASDIRKLYNMLHLDLSSIPYSLVLYHSSLDKDTEPEVFYMRRAWYGVVCVSAQATTAVRRLAETFQDEFPKGAEALKNSLYVDDLFVTADSEEERNQILFEAKEILAKGGFQLKYEIKSGQAPPSEASDDGQHVSTLGYRWNTEQDKWSLGVQEINFNKKDQRCQAAK